jgi:hypothetical protein
MWEGIANHTPVVSWLPGDFRTKDELQKSMVSNEPVGRVMLDVMPPA